MKTNIAFYLLVIGAISSMSGCITVKRDPAPRTTSTTTEQTTVVHPRSNTVETQTTRTY